MQTGTLLQELQEEENKYESVSDRSKTSIIESPTATGEELLLKIGINIQAQSSEEIKGITHRIIYIDDVVVTKGDNNIYPDDPISLENIVCAISKTPRFLTW